MNAFTRQSHVTRNRQPQGPERNLKSPEGLSHHMGIPSVPVKSSFAGIAMTHQCTEEGGTFKYRQRWESSVCSCFLFFVVGVNKLHADHQDLQLPFYAIL